jgi:hypothetical protein
MEHLMCSTALTGRLDGAGALAHARASHPAGTARYAASNPPVANSVIESRAAEAAEARGSVTPRGWSPSGRSGSGGGRFAGHRTEYGLLAVVAATMAGVVTTWASGGALVTLFNRCCVGPAAWSAHEPHHRGGPAERRAPRPGRRPAWPTGPAGASGSRLVAWLRARVVAPRAALLESVLVLPVALLVVGVLEVAVVTRDVLVAHEVARAGARAAATSTGTAAVERAAREVAPELEVVVLVDPVTRRDGDLVQVTISSRRPVLGVPTTVRASSVARVEPAVGTR